MPSTTLYLVRHGEADGADGSVDPALTDRGVLRSLAVAERLGLCGVGEILRSSKRRAVEAARLIGDHLTLRPDPSPLLDDRTPIPDDWSEVPDRYHTFLRSVPQAEQDADGPNTPTRYLIYAGQSCASASSNAGSIADRTAL